MLTIAGHVLIDHSRKHREALPLAEGLLPATDLSSLDLRADIADALARLPRHQARLLDLIFVYGFTHEEVAAMDGSSQGAVKTAAWRARESFRQLYSEGVGNHE